MTDSKESDPPVCPVHGKKCPREAQIVALEDTLGEIVTELRALNTWAPSVDTGIDRMSRQSGVVAQGLEDLRRDLSGMRNDVSELQEIVKNGNGKAP